MKIKLCGFREPESLKIGIETRPDYIGFIFYKQSKRYLTPHQAHTLLTSIQQAQPALYQPEIIGVFVNESLTNILKTIDIVGLTGVQLHGSESPTFIKTLRKKQKHLIIWKAFQVKNTNTFKNAINTYGNLLENSEILNAILLDGFTPHQYGGTGEQIDFTLLPNWTALKQNIILAGGIRTENLSKFMSQPVYGLDVSSSLEENYIKIPRKITTFMNKFKTNLSKL